MLITPVPNSAVCAQSASPILFTPSPFSPPVLPCPNRQRIYHPHISCVQVLTVSGHFVKIICAQAVLPSSRALPTPSSRWASPPSPFQATHRVRELPIYTVVARFADDLRHKTRPILFFIPSFPPPAASATTRCLLSGLKAHRLHLFSTPTTHRSRLQLVIAIYMSPDEEGL